MRASEFRKFQVFKWVSGGSETLDYLLKVEEPGVEESASPRGGRGGHPLYTCTYTRTHTHTCMYTHKSKARRTHSSDSLPRTQPQALHWASGQRKEGRCTFSLSARGSQVRKWRLGQGKPCPVPSSLGPHFLPRRQHRGVCVPAPPHGHLGAALSPQVSEPPSHLSVKQAPCPAHCRCSMKGKFLPPTPPSTWSCTLDPASITFSPFNEWAPGHCRRVGGSDLPLMPTAPSGAHPGPLRQRSGWRRHLPSWAAPLPNPAPPPMTIFQAGTQTEVLQGRSLF